MRAQIDLLPTHSGGRSTPLGAGYRSVLRPDGTNEDIGFEWLPDAGELGPGCSGRGEIAVWALDEPAGLESGTTFEVREGTRVIGRGRVE